MNDINKRYNVGLSIINNNRGLIAMLKTILNKCYSVLCNTIDKIGEYIYNVGYPTKSIKKKLKYAYVRLIRNNFILSNLRGFKHLWKLGDVVNGYVDYCKFKNSTRQTNKHIWTNIEAIELTIKSMREDYESLKTFHNNLSIDYRDNSASNNNLLKLKNELNARIDIIKSNNTPFLETKHDEYKYLVDIGEANTLKKIAKILSAYDNDGININIDDIVDDINDKFKGFNYMFDDICDDDDNINLGD